MTSCRKLQAGFQLDNMLKDIEDSIKNVRASPDGCGSVTIKIVTKRIVSIDVQMRHNVKETFDD